MLTEEVYIYICKRVIYSYEEVRVLRIYISLLNVYVNYLINRIIIEYQKRLSHLIISTLLNVQIRVQKCC